MKVPYILLETLNAFGVTKSHTTAYHLSGDGLVERFNRLLLQMLRAYVQQHNDWEKYRIVGKFSGRKVWRIDWFRAFGERKFGELIDQPIDY